MEKLARVPAELLVPYILKVCGQISHIKLHKLLYYIESWHLVFIGVPLLDEEFEAWLHGPVVRRLFGKYRHAGIYAYEALPMVQREIDEGVAVIEGALTKEQLEIVTDVLKEYGQHSGYHLECLTHEEAPWKEARAGVEPGEASNQVIPKESMKRFYSSLLG